LAIDLVRRAADEINVQTAKVMFLIEISSWKSGDGASHPRAGCAALLTAAFAYLRRTEATPAFQPLNLL
jgi:hypothetical protein